MCYNDANWNVSVSEIGIDENGNPLIFGHIRKGTGFVSRFKANLDKVEIFYGHVPKFIRAQIQNILRGIL